MQRSAKPTATAAFRPRSSSTSSATSVRFAPGGCAAAARWEIMCPLGHWAKNAAGDVTSGHRCWPPVPNWPLVEAAVKLPSDHENGRGAPVLAKVVLVFRGWPARIEVGLGMLELVPIKSPDVHR